MVLGRFLLRGLAIGVVVGAVTGLVLGLIAYPPTVWFAILELGIPGAVVGAACGGFAGLVVMARRTDHSRVAIVVLLGMAGLVAVAVLFAPIITGGWCTDAPVSAISTCETIQRSLIGIDTSMWLWLTLTGVVVVATVLVARGSWAKRP